MMPGNTGSGQFLVSQSMPISFQGIIPTQQPPQQGMSSFPSIVGNGHQGVPPHPNLPFTTAAPSQFMTLSGIVPPPTTTHVVSAGQTSSTTSSSVPVCDWTEHKSPDGRIYYYNSKTKQSMWDKPEELKTPAEKLLSQCPWKEYKSDTGKTYYHNSVTKESKWTIPPELEEIKARILQEQQLSSGNVALKQGTNVPPQLPLNIVNQMIPSVSLQSLHQGVLPPQFASTMNIPKMDSIATVDESSKQSALNSSQDDSTRQSDDVKSDSETSSSGDESPSTKRTSAPKVKDKKEATEIFKELLRDKNIHSTTSWEQASKLINRDPRFRVFEKNNERKQAFNAYKVQKQKEEKEEGRLRLKKAKEELEVFLLNSDKMTSNTKYYRCEELFANCEEWKAVPDAERREIYEDTVISLAKKEKEETRELKKRNMKKLGELLEKMPQITYETSWSEAQQLLVENQAFSQDRELLGMDKIDALGTFEKHIKELEIEEEEDKEQEKKRKRRLERKNRDAFQKLLDELHEQGKLTSMSLWVELYPVISSDPRFSAMLGQSGSSPLDLFKFYVEDLKSRYQDEKRIIKEILLEKSFEVNTTTDFEEFATVVCEDRRAATLDAGNVKLTFNSLVEKAEVKMKDRLKEEAKRMKIWAQDLVATLKEYKVDYQTCWEEIRPKIEHTEAFRQIESEEHRRRIFDEFLHEQDESCGHHHHGTKKMKKVKKHKKRSSSTDSSALDSSDEELRRSKKKSKKRRKRSPSYSFSDSSDSEIEKRSKKKNKKSKKKKKKKMKSSSDESYESEKEDRKKRKKSSKRDNSVDDYELSETELETKRALLLKELQNASGVSP